jgi:hypothetical protein
MIVYQCNAKWSMFAASIKLGKDEGVRQNKRRHDRVETYRRIWFWHEDRWNQSIKSDNGRNGKYKNTVQEHM